MAHKDPADKSAYGKARWAAIMADPEKAEKERARRRKLQQARRAAMTPEELEAKREKDRARRRNETPEQRDARLARLRKFTRTEKGLECRRRWRHKMNKTPEALARLKAFNEKVRADPVRYALMKEKMRERYRKRRAEQGVGVRSRKLTPQEQADRRRLDMLRRHAKAEARETGENVYLIFERWGCLLPKDLIKHQAATGSAKTAPLTDEERLAVLFERDSEAAQIREKRAREREAEITRSTAFEDLSPMEQLARKRYAKQKKARAAQCDVRAGIEV